jgi:hypothetical protein
MLRRWFNGIALVSAVLLVLAAGLAACAPSCNHRLSLSGTFHVGLCGGYSENWTGNIVFFNDPVNGPYTGSIIDVASTNAPPPVTRLFWRVGEYGAISGTNFDSQGEWKLKFTAWTSPGIYYRHFVFRGRGVLWTAMLNLGHLMIFFGLLPVLWVLLRVRDRWRPRPNGEGVRSLTHRAPDPFS